MQNPPAALLTSTEKLKYGIRVENKANAGPYRSIWQGEESSTGMLSMSSMLLPQD
jgi:hypothetical protein